MAGEVAELTAKESVMRKVLSVPTIQRLGLKFDGPSFIDNAQYMEDVNQVWQRRSVFAVEEWFRTPAHTWFTTRTPGIITPSFRSLLVRSVELTMAKKKAEIPSVEENPLGFHRRYQVIKHGRHKRIPMPPTLCFASIATATTAIT